MFAFAAATAPGEERVDEDRHDRVGEARREVIPSCLGRGHTRARVHVSFRDNSDLAVCMWCWVDIVTCGACRPDDLWYYSIKYDDG